MQSQEEKNLLRVVTVASRSGAYGGPFDTASRQVEMASEMGFETTLLAGTFQGDEPSSTYCQIQEVFVPVKRHLTKRGFSTVCSFEMMRALWLNIAKSDLVHVSFAREMIPIVASVITLLHNKKLIIQPHGMLTSKQRRLHHVVDTITRYIYRRADRVIALTASEEGDLQKWAGRVDSNYVVLGNPVPVHQRAKQRTLSQNPTIAFIARLHSRKNVTSFVAAAAMLEQSQNEFIVVGPDGGQINIVREADQKLKNLRYLGAVSQNQVQDILDHVDVFALTSINEPWGNVLATALSMGIPVVVSESSALANVIKEYDAGVTYPDGDSACLAQSINRLTTDASRFAQLSRNALKLSEVLLDRREQMRILASAYI